MNIFELIIHRLYNTGKNNYGVITHLEMSREEYLELLEYVTQHNMVWRPLLDRPKTFMGVPIKIGSHL